MIEKHKLPPDFDSNFYLQVNPDVKAAGVDPEQHFLKYGIKEGRLYKPNQLDNICGSPTEADFHLHKNQKTKRSTIAKHTNIWEWVRKTGNKKRFRVLEIGSRSVISDALWSKVIPDCDYTGFDVLAGKNVNVIGDAHHLSTYFKPKSFDLIISFAVFEHLAMPWVVVEEISKVLKTGGHICIETHFSFSEHELPWHFFQFNSRALEVLFCPELGFELIDSGLDNPIVGRFSHYSADYLRGKLVTDLYAHSSIIAKKTHDINLEANSSFNWHSVATRISKESIYPSDSSVDL